MATDRAVVPIEPAVSLRQKVEKALASAIMSGEMTPGVLFSAPTLAARFGVSATPVREAMLQLEKRGFIETVRNKGFRVTAVSEKELQDIVDVRLMLEPPAMRSLAGSLPGDRQPELRVMADRIVQGAARGEFAAYLAADADFHAVLTAMLGNERLTALVGELRAATRLPGLSGLLATAELAVSAQEHHELLDLLASGDGNAAERLMRRHISHVLGWWSGHPEPATS